MGSEEGERGGCLRAFLVVALISLALTILSYLVAESTLRQFVPSLNNWAVPILSLGALANFIFAIIIWNWKKWVVFAYTAIALFIFAVAFLGGIPLVGILLAVVGLAALFLPVLLMRNVARNLASNVTTTTSSIPSETWTPVDTNAFEKSRKEKAKTKS